jgi:hypothetical protein
VSKDQKQIYSEWNEEAGHRWLRDLLGNMSNEKTIYEDERWTLTIELFNILEGDYWPSIFIYDRRDREWHYYAIATELGELEPQYVVGQGTLHHIPHHIRDKVELFWKMRRLF